MYYFIFSCICFYFWIPSLHNIACVCAFPKNIPFRNCLLCIVYINDKLWDNVAFQDENIKKLKENPIENFSFSYIFTFMYFLFYENLNENHIYL